MDNFVAQFKKGYKTTEFWLTLLSAALVLLDSTFGWGLDVQGITALVASNIAYVLGRSYLKGKRASAVGDVAETTLYTEARSGSDQQMP